MPCPALPELPAAAVTLEMVQNAVQNAAGDCIYHRVQKPAQDPACVRAAGGGTPALAAAPPRRARGLAFACLADGAHLDSRC